MKSLLRTVTLTSGLALAAFSANAVPEPAHHFENGFYLGAGAGWSHVEGPRRDFIRDIDTLVDTHIPNAGMHIDSVEAILFLGYLCRLADTGFIFAFEPFFGYGPGSQHVSANVNPGGVPVRISSILYRQYIYGAVARFGYLVASNWLLYFMAGYEGARFKHVMSDELNIHTRKFRNFNSPAFGAGVETELNGVRVGLEFKHNPYGRKTIKAENVTQREQHIGVFKPRSSSVLLKFTLPINKIG